MSPKDHPTEAAPASVSRQHGEVLQHDVLSCLAHDLRQPISAAVVAVSVLLQDMPSIGAVDRTDLLHVARESLTTMALLVDQLLVYHEGPSGAVSISTGPVELAPIVQQALHELKLGPSDARLDFPMRGVVVIADAVLLKRALVNVLSNAQRHSPFGVPVTIRCATADNEATLQVIDHGPGVSPRQRQDIFDRGWQSSDGTGSGLGLYLSRSFVDAMGGSIDATDTVGGGPTVTFSLAASLTPHRRVAAEEF